MFFAEVAAYRIGTRKLMRLGVAYSSHAADETDAHAHSHAHDPPLAVDTSAPEHPGHVHPVAIPQATARDLEGHEDTLTLNKTRSKAHSHGHGHGHSHGHSHSHDEDTDKQLVEKAKADPEIASHSDLSTLTQGESHAEAAAQLVGVAVLEFGVILHSIIIGLTLSVSDEFIVLFIVIIFHQMFEGLGLGSRIAGLSLPYHLSWTRYAAAILYAICTPVGVAIGLGVRESYNGNGKAALIVSGTLDAISAGILLYTGLVELLAHEIVLNPRMMKSSDGKLAYVFICMCLGAGLMALLGRWA
jgi:zinc transporter 1/2/3